MTGARPPEPAPWPRAFLLLLFLLLFFFTGIGPGRGEDQSGLACDGRVTYDRCAPVLHAYRWHTLAPKGCSVFLGLHSEITVKSRFTSLAGNPVPASLLYDVFLHTHSSAHALLCTRTLLHTHSSAHALATLLNTTYTSPLDGSGNAPAVQNAKPPSRGVALSADTHRTCAPECARSACRPTR